MAKFKLQPDPTFKAIVGIPVPGAADAQVEFTFKYRNIEELQAWCDSFKTTDESPVAAIMDMCVAWELSDPFNPDSLTTLTKNYPSSFMAIFDTYLNEFSKARVKNSNGRQ